MADHKITPETEACARLLDGAERELQTIRTTIASVSLEAANNKAVAEAMRPARPLRARPAGEPPPLRVDRDTTTNTPRPTLAQRLQSALNR